MSRAASKALAQPLPAQPMFTVQQIELIRRLRNSGLSKEQVVQAFESFEKVDAELGDIYNVPMSVALQQNAVVMKNTPPSMQVRAADSQVSSRVAPRTTTRSLLTQQAVFPSANSPSTTNVLTVNAPNGGHPPSAPQPSLQPADSEAEAPVHVNRRFPSATRRLQEVAMKMEPEDSFEEGGGGVSQDSSSAGDLDAIEASCVEVDDFIQKGTEKMHEEIREFLFAHPALAHNDIAEAAGVKVSSISKFLIGNFQGLDPQALWSLSRWFLAARRKQKQQQQQHSMMMMMQSGMQQLPGSMQALSNCKALQEDGNGNGVSMDMMGVDFKAELGNNGGGAFDQDGLAVNFTPRRERFTFRTQHLEVLEAYFKTKQYPTYEERSDIAQRCNDIMERVCGRGLSEKEQMQPQNVAYWFSNRRKDIKRMAREGGIEMASVVLPSKVKQATPSSSQSTPAFTMMDKDTAVLNPMCVPQAFPTNTFPTNTFPTSTFPTNTFPTSSFPINSGGFFSAAENVASEMILMNMAGATFPSAEHSSGDAVSDVAKDSVMGSTTESVSVKQHLSSSNGGGSVVDRIASAISSHLLSKPEDTTAAVVPSSPVAVTADSQQP